MDDWDDLVFKPVKFPLEEIEEFEEEEDERDR